MKRILITSAVCFLGLSMHGQYVQDYLKAADNYYKKGDYASASAYYEKYFSKEDKNRAGFNPYTPQSVSQKTAASATQQELALWNLAESYRQLNYPEKAETYYRRIVEQSREKFPLAIYHQSTALRALAKYSEAEAGFTAFLQSYSTQDEYRRSAEREIQNLQFIQKQLARKDLKYYTVSKGGEAVNGTGASYAPVLFGNTILFTSTRPLSSEAREKVYTNRLYQAQYAGGVISAVNAADIEQPKAMEQGVAAMAPGGQTLFLTRWSQNENERSAAIYTSQNRDGRWSDPVKMDESINVAGASTQQPFVTADGKYLFFSSNRPGGQGGFDIWYAELGSDGKPGMPVNAGTAINTAADEEAPYYHDASATLVFASNGRIGMGGFDLFQSKGKAGSWTSVENLGYPVNSIKDDIYFLSLGSAKNMLEDVWLSSDRDAACCLELFSLKKIRPLRQISGTIVSCDGSKLLPGATVVITDPSTGRQVHSGTVDATGNYRFTLEDYQPLTLKAEASGFIAGSLQITVPADKESESMTVSQLCLVPEPPKVNESFVVNNLFYEYDKSQVKPESYPALDEIVRMLNTYPNLAIEISGHTDNKGSDSYNQALSEARAKTVVAYLISKGIDPSRLSAKGFGETMPIAPNTKPDGSDNPEGREQNRRTEFKVLRN